jgi:preprotein translocase subunit YajC
MNAAMILAQVSTTGPTTAQAPSPGGATIAPTTQTATPGGATGGPITQTSSPGTATPAPATQTPPAGGVGGLLSSPLVPMIAVMAIFMFYSFNSKRKQEKARQETLNSMKRGDRVQTIGGILGTIVDVRDAEVVVKVDESNNTKIKFARSAVNKVMGEEEKTESK